MPARHAAQSLDPPALHVPAGQSEHDVLAEAPLYVPASHVEAFVRRRKRHGCAVTTLGPLAGGLHCNLLSTHPEEYADAISGFAQSLEKRTAAEGLG